MTRANNVDIGSYSHIRKVIIDKDVIIPLRTKTGYDLEEDRKRYHVTPSGIVVIAKGRLCLKKIRRRE